MSQNQTEQPSEAGKSRSAKRMVFAAVAAVIMLVAAVVVFWERNRTEEPDLEITYINLNFFNYTMYPPAEGCILWAIDISFQNDADQSVIIDPCEFVVETHNGSLHYFAWNYGNLTETTIVAEYSSGVPVELPASKWGHMQAPYELPEYTYPTRVIWKSALGDVLSEDFGERGQQRLNEFLEG
jgi:hypothetical protein